MYIDTAKSQIAVKPKSKQEKWRDEHPDDPASIAFKAAEAKKSEDEKKQEEYKNQGSMMHNIVYFM